LIFPVPRRLRPEFRKLLRHGKVGAGLRVWEFLILASAIGYSTCTGVRPARKRHAAGVLTLDGNFVVGVSRRYIKHRHICCAEPSAIGTAITSGSSRIAQVAVLSDRYMHPQRKVKIFPESCGGCLDVSCEHAAAKMPHHPLLYFRCADLRELGRLPKAEDMQCRATTLERRLHNAYGAHSFPGDSKRNGLHPVSTPVLVQLPSELQRALLSGRNDLRTLQRILPLIQPHLDAVLRNSTFCSVMEGGMPEAAAVITPDGVVAFGASFQTGSPRLSNTGVDVAIGTAIAAGHPEFIAAISYVRDEPLGWEDEPFDRLDLSRLTRMHHPPGRNIHLAAWHRGKSPRFDTVTRLTPQFAI
jgi:cytidine deaminase